MRCFTKQHSNSATELLNFWKKFLSICSYIKPLIELRTKFSKDFEREKVYGDLCGHSGWRRVVQGSRLSRYKLAHHLDYKFSITPNPHASKFSFSSASPPPPAPATISEADYDYCSPRNSFCPKFAPIVKLCSQKPKQNPNWCNQSSSRALSTSTHMIYKEFKQHIKRRAL